MLKIFENYNLSYNVLKYITNIKKLLKYAQMNRNLYRVVEQLLCENYNRKKINMSPKFNIYHYTYCLHAFCYDTYFVEFVEKLILKSDISNIHELIGIVFRDKFHNRYKYHNTGRRFITDYSGEFYKYDTERFEKLLINYITDLGSQSSHSPQSHLPSNNLVEG